VRPEEESGDRRLLEERVDPFEMVWPSSACARNLEDARWVMRVKEIDRADAEALFPDAAPEDLHASWAADSGSDASVDRSTAPADSYREGSSSLDKLPSRVTVVEYVWLETEEYAVATLPSQGVDPQTGQPLPPQTQEIPAGQEEEAPEDAPENFKPRSMIDVAKERITAAGGSVEEKRRPCCYIAHIGRKVLAREKLPTRDDLIYRAVTGKYDRKDRVFYGVIRHAKDPQRWANKWRLQALHILNTSAKNTLLVEEGVFEDIDDARRDLAQPGGIVEMQPGSLSGGRMQWKEATGFDAGFGQMMMQADAAIPECMGVNSEILGMQDREQAGVLEVERKKAVVTVLATYFDNLRRVRKSIGRLIMRYLVAGYIDPEELARVVGQEKAQLLPQLLSPESMKFDVVIDEAPSSPNAKERNWALLSPLLPTILGMDIPAEAKLALFKASPIPSSVMDDIERIITEAKPAQDEQAQKAAQMQEAAAQAKIQKDQSSSELDRAKVEQIHAETGIGVAQATVDMVERPQQAAREHASTQFERNITTADQMLKRERGQAQDGLARQKLDQQAQSERERAAAAERDAMMKSMNGGGVMG
jgi:hypothetical protein